MNVSGPSLQYLHLVGLHGTVFGCFWNEGEQQGRLHATHQTSDTDVGALFGQISSGQLREAFLCSCVGSSSWNQI